MVDLSNIVLIDTHSEGDSHTDHPSVTRHEPLLDFCAIQRGLGRLKEQGGPFRDSGFIPA